MDNVYFKFNPGTHTVRFPKPTRFDHLLGFASKIEQYLTIHNQEDIVNINQLLEQTLNLQVSNIISRVIAQIIGETGTGFITIKGTDDGALHVSVQEDPLSLKAPLYKTISFTGTGTHDIIAAVADKKHKITAIVFTVAGETNIRFEDDDNYLSGFMDFGGTDEPRGFVSNHGQITLNCATNKKFMINSSIDVQVSGYVLYYDEA